MANWRRDRWPLVVLFILALSLVQCTLAPAATPTPGATAPSSTSVVFTPPRGGTYILAQTGDASTMQPLLTFDTVSGFFQYLVYDSLLRADPRQGGALTLSMAESYAFSDDGLTLMFKLRHDMRWSDGTPITADDVLFTFETKWKMAAGQTLRDTFTSLTVSDPYTLVYHLPRPNCAALLAANIMPLPRRYFESVDIANNEYNMKPPVASGPFIMTEWVRDGHATFVANNLYFKGRPNLDTFVIQSVSSRATANAAYMKGEVDGTYIEPLDWEMMSKLPSSMVLETYNPLSYYLVLFRSDHPFLQDKRVRQALSYAVERQTMIDGFFLGHARPTWSPIGEGNWGYSADVTRYDYNPQKARELLKEAGWTPGAGSILVKDGKPFTLRLFYPNLTTAFEQIAVLVQKQYRDIGVNVEVYVENLPTFLNRLQNTRDFDVVVSARSVGDTHVALMPYLKGNSGGYYNPEVDRLHAEAATVPRCRQEDRQKVYAQALKVITDDPPAVFLLTGAVLQTITTRLEIGADLKARTNWPIEQWYVKPGK